MLLHDPCGMLLCCHMACASSMRQLQQQKERQQAQVTHFSMPQMNAKSSRNTGDVALHMV